MNSSDKILNYISDFSRLEETSNNCSWSRRRPKPTEVVHASYRLSTALDHDILLEKYTVTNIKYVKAIII